MPVIQQVQGGSVLANYLTGNVRRLDTAQMYATHIITYYANEISTGRTLQQQKDDMLALPALFPTKRVWLCTIPYRVSRTDGGQPFTTANQIANANADYTAMNIWRLGRGRPFEGCFDFAGEIEDPIVANKVLPESTLDGTHFIDAYQRGRRRG